MFVTPGPEKTSNHGLQECRWCNQEFSKHQTSKHRNKEWAPILWQIELVLQIDNIACATSLQQPQRQDTAILKGLMSLGLPLGFNHWPSQPGKTNQKAARHCPKKILWTVPSTPLVWLSRRVIGFSEIIKGNPKEWEIVPIDSPSNGFPVGKITSHLHQIQDHKIGAQSPTAASESERSLGPVTRWSQFGTHVHQFFEYKKRCNRTCSRCVLSNASLGGFKKTSKDLNIYLKSMTCYIYIYSYKYREKERGRMCGIPVVPRKAVEEVSKIGKL